MKTHTYLLYFPQKPDDLFKFLDSVLLWEERNKARFLFWVDNDDHKVSAKFYTLRKYLKKGIQLEVFINPRTNTEQEVWDFLVSKTKPTEFVVKNDEQATSIYDLDVQNIVSFGVLNEKT